MQNKYHGSFCQCAYCVKQRTKEKKGEVIPNYNDWEQRMRKVKRVLYSHVHPDQEFKLILVARDVATDINSTRSIELGYDSTDIVFEGIPLQADKLLPDGMIVFVPVELDGGTNG